MSLQADLCQARGDSSCIVHCPSGGYNRLSPGQNFCSSFPKIPCFHLHIANLDQDFMGQSILQSNRYFTRRKGNWMVVGTNLLLCTLAQRNGTWCELGCNQACKANSNYASPCTYATISVPTSRMNGARRKSKLSKILLRGLDFHPLLLVQARAFHISKMST